MGDTRLSSSELQAFLERVPLFQGLGPQTCAVMARVARLKRVEKREVLFYQQDPGDAAYLVRSGAIAILLTTADGRELVINEMHAGDFFGELALLTSAPRSASAVASQESQVLVLPRAEFMGELEREPKLMRHLLDTLAQRLQVSSERERALAFLDAPARLGRVLLEMDAAESQRGYLTISQDELAQRIGVARQTTAKILGQWRRAGWIVTGRGKVVVINRAALRKRAAEDEL